jgi:hypothetical protein
MLKRKMKFVSDYIQFLDNKRLYHEKQFHHLGAVSRIVSSYRLYQMKKRLFNMLHWMKYTKAILIQKVVRGYLIRKKNKNFKLEKLQRQKLEEEKAVVLQKFFRRIVAEQKVLRLMELKEQERMRHHQQKLFKLAEGLSSFAKMKMFMVKCYRNVRPFRYLVLKEKAILIQKTYRGYHGRQRMKFVRLRARLDEFYRIQNLKIKQLRKLQRVWRGFITR